MENIQNIIINSQSQMKIESPLDYQYSEDPLPSIVKSRELRTRPTPTKIRRDLKTQSIFTPVPRKQLNYFQKMFKEVKKKSYVNLFIRKLKQATILHQSINHQLSQGLHEKKRINPLKTFRWLQSLEIGFTIFQIILTITVSIITSLCIIYPQVSHFAITRFFSFILSFCYLSRIILSFFARSSIDIQHEQKKYLYVEQAFKNSMSLNLLIDVLIVIVYFIDSFDASSALDVLKILIVLKLSSISRKINNLEIILINNCFKEQYWALTKILLSNFLIAHLIAIILNLMIDPSHSWMDEKNLMSQAWIQKYTWSYYWATNIMLTVGFGDIVPANSREAVFLIFIEALSCILLAYNISSVGAIIKKITSYQEEKESDIKTFFRMEDNEYISDDIKHKIANYITQSAELKRNFNVEEQKKLLQKLPKSFYEQFKRQSNIHIFQSTPFFRNLSLTKLRDLSLKIEKRLTHPQQIIVESGNVPEILIVNNGTISMNMNRIGLQTHGKEVQKFRVKQNEYKILSLYFFINKELNYDIKCKDYALVYFLSKKELQNCLLTNKSGYEYYCMIKDKDRFNPSDWEVNLCDLCKRKNHHTLFECPKLHFMPIKYHVISRMLAKNPHKVLKYKRQLRVKRTKKSASCLKIRQQVQKQYYDLHEMSLLMKKMLLNNESQILKATQTHVEQNKDQIAYTYSTKNLAQSSFKNSGMRYEKVYKEVGQKIKQQLLNKAFFEVSKSETQLQCDFAHNYTSYFHSCNPNMLECKKRRFFG